MAAPTAALAVTTAFIAALATLPAVSAALPRPSNLSPESSALSPASSAEFPASSRASPLEFASVSKSVKDASVLTISAVKDAYCSSVMSPRSKAALASSATCFIMSNLSEVCSICLLSNASFRASNSTLVGSSFKALSTSFNAAVVLLIELFASCKDLVSPLVLPSMSTVIPNILLAITNSYQP